MATATPPKQPGALHSCPSVELTYDQIAAWLDTKAPELCREEFAAIVAIMHGGVIPAVICSYATDAPLHYLGYDRNTQTAEWQGPAAPPGRLLLCQDIADGGDDLVNCLTMLRTTHPDVMVLTVQSEGHSQIIPNWSMGFPGQTVLMPWRQKGQSRPVNKE